MIYIFSYFPRHKTRFFARVVKYIPLGDHYWYFFLCKNWRDKKIQGIDTKNKPHHGTAQNRTDKNQYVTES
ncbi:MAG TPA: hypothetical protein DCS88_01520 [Alphaproteobacteria bacterium]|nr:hypothetical protein [Alphaproteobacteria bacterium]